MIDKKSRRVVIINNIQSDTIDQAIFILKNDKYDKKISKTDADVATEAQTIINNYIRQVERLKSENNQKSRKPRSSSRRNRIRPRLVLFTILTVIATLCFIFKDVLLTAFGQY